MIEFEPYRAAFVRGGTIKGLVFNRQDLPERSKLADLFLRAMGSPDSTGRQLNGMGGGLSSLSKVCIVEPSKRPEADVDYTFAQVQIHDSIVDYSGNCGNMASVIAPYAITEGLVAARDGQQKIRIRNVNTNKVIVATIQVSRGKVVEQGSAAIPGVSGTGTPITLEFLNPGGSITGSVLPDSGSATSELMLDSGRRVTVSLVDVANACIFVDADQVGMSGTESPQEIERMPDVLSELRAIREAGSVRMGISQAIAELEVDRRSHWSELWPRLEPINASMGQSSPTLRSTSRCA